MRDTIIPISDCEICSHLDEIETDFRKENQEDLTRSLPNQAGRLVKDVQAPDFDWGNHIEQCPICGVYYRYESTYEYLVYGSEDTTTLTRLTPAQVRARLSEAEYDRLIAAQRGFLEHPAAMTRFYAAKCLVAHHLAHDDLAPLAALLAHPDVTVVDGALYSLVRHVVEQGRLPALARLREPLTQLSRQPEQPIANRARYLLNFFARTRLPAPP